MKYDKYIMQLIHDHKLTKVWPIWKVLPITKCFIGCPKAKYVIWWGKKVLDSADSYKDAIKLRRKIWNAA